MWSHFENQFSEIQVKNKNLIKKEKSPIKIKNIEYHTKENPVRKKNGSIPFG